jgi:hypothetical protein
VEVELENQWYSFFNIAFGFMCFVATIWLGFTNFDHGLPRVGLSPAHSSCQCDAQVGLYHNEYE